MEDRPDDDAVVGVGGEIADEGAVDLELVAVEVLEVGERGIAGAEVVESEADAQLIDLADRLAGARRVGHRHLLGDLELEAPAVEAMGLELLAQALRKEVVD